MRHLLLAPHRLDHSSMIGGLRTAVKDYFGLNDTGLLYNVLTTRGNAIESSQARRDLKSGRSLTNTYNPSKCRFGVSAIGNSVQLCGASYIYGTGADTIATTETTLLCWTIPTAVPPGTMRACLYVGNVSPGQGQALYYGADSKFSFAGLRSTGAWLTITSPNRYGLNKPALLIARTSNGVVISGSDIYINGKFSVKSSTVGSGYTCGNCLPMIGTYANTTYALTGGWVGESAFWTRCLTAAEIEGYYQWATNTASRKYWIVSGQLFKPVWARNSNQLIQPGRVA